jgi:hypothetical protein
MIQALFLIFAPGKAWNRVLEKKRDWKMLLVMYLLPMMLLVSAVEWFGLVQKGKWQPIARFTKKFTMGEATVYELAQILSAFLVIGICTLIIRAFGDTFHSRNSRTQAFTVVAYGLSPVFLFRLLDAFPTGVTAIPPIAWAIGLFFTAAILYHGVPIIMQPDPPHAFGLFVMSSFVVVIVTALERFSAMWCLSGHLKPVDSFLSDLATKLPF